MKSRVERIFVVSVVAVAIGLAFTALPGCDRYAAELGRWAAEKDAR